MRTNARVSVDTPSGKILKDCKSLNAYFVIVETDDKEYSITCPISGKSIARCKFQQTAEFFIVKLCESLGEGKLPEYCNAMAANDIDGAKAVLIDSYFVKLFPLKSMRPKAFKDAIKDIK